MHSSDSVLFHFKKRSENLVSRNQEARRLLFSFFRLSRCLSKYQLAPARFTSFPSLLLSLARAEWNFYWGLSKHNKLHKSVRLSVTSKFKRRVDTSTFICTRVLLVVQNMDVLQSLALAVILNNYTMKNVIFCNFYQVNFIGGMFFIGLAQKKLIYTVRLTWK